MLPRINPRGTSFKGITSYLLYGKIGEENPARVEWSMTGNMYTNDIEKAAKVMAFTAMNAEDIKRESGGSLAGVKAEGKAVYHNSLSWRVGDEPSEQHMKETALDYLDKRGLSNHEYYVVAHNDTDHKHLHIVVNLVDHETGKTSKLGLDKRAAQEWALEYERKHGIQCELREENAAKREQGEHVKHQDKKQDYSVKITRAYYAADNGQSFVNALKEEGLNLAKARRGNNFVIVDDKGDIQKLARQLDIEEKGKEKTAAIQNLLKDIDREKLEDAAELSKKIKIEIEQKQEIFDREAQEVKAQNALSDAAELHAKETEKQEQEKSNVEKKLKEKLKEIHEGGRNLKSELWDLQQKEKSELTQKLKDTDSFKEAQNREYYEHIINADKKRIDGYKNELEKEGFSGAVYRFRHGKKAQEEINNIEKNIENTQMRLDDAVGGLTAGDYRRLAKQRQTHYEQRENLRIDIQLDIFEAEKKAKLDAMERDSNILLERAKLEEKHNKNDYENVKGEDMAQGKTSREKWEEIAVFDDAVNEQAREEQSIVSKEEIDLAQGGRSFEQELENEQSQGLFNEISQPKEELSIEEQKAILIEQNLQQLNEKSEQIDRDHDEGLER